MLKMQIGENIKKYRLAAELSQAKLGELMGLTNQTISSWEKNRTEPNIVQVEQMALILKCNKSDLIGYKKEVPEYVSGSVEVIDLYSKCTPEQRKAVLALLRSFVGQE